MDTKAKVTLTLDSAQLQELRALVGARSLSAAVGKALRRVMEILDGIGQLLRRTGRRPVTGVPRFQDQLTQGAPGTGEVAQELGRRRAGERGAAPGSSGSACSRRKGTS